MTVFECLKCGEIHDDFEECPCMIIWTEEENDD